MLSAIADLLGVLLMLNYLICSPRHPALRNPAKVVGSGGVPWVPYS